MPAVWLCQRGESGGIIPLKIRKEEAVKVVIAEVSVVPLGTDTPSVGSYVAAAVKALKRQKRVKYQLTAMGTILEGEMEQVLALTAKMHESVFKAGAARVVTRLTIDDRRDKHLTIDGKIQSVLEKLG